VRIEVLTVPGCPNGPVLMQRLAAVLGGDQGIPVVQRRVADPQEAARLGMHGSPTLLIDGRDPFAGPDTAPSLSCRLYLAPDGSRQGAPSVEDLRRVLR
jgi:Thioredoxin domain